MSRARGGSGWRVARWGALVLVAMLVGFAIGTARAASDETADTLLAMRVRGALLAHLGVDGLRLGVAARGSEVGLAGTVRRPATAELAAQVAKSVPGVSSVRSEIAVEPPPVADGRTPLQRLTSRARRELGDAVLETQVKTQLIQELGRPAFGIEVEAEDGAVSLSGEVPDTARRMIAVDTAHRSDGVKSVVDLLRVG